MSGTSHNVGAVGVKSHSLCQYRIAFGVFLPWSHWVFCPENHLTVEIARTALGAHQVIIFAHLEEMRTLYPYRVLNHMGSASKDFLLLTDDAVVLHVKLVYPYRALTLIVGLARWGVVVHDVSLTVLIKEERRVDTAHLFQINRLAPSLCRILTLHIEITLAYIGSNHIESLVLLVIRYCRGKDTSRHTLIAERQLTLTVEHMTYLLPVDKVLALEDWYTGEERERRVDKVIGISLATDGRVGIESSHHGVKILIGIVDSLVESTVVAFIAEVLECCGLCHGSCCHNSCCNHSQ